MKRLLSFCLILVLVLVCLYFGWTHFTNRIPGNILTFLEQADRFELLSLQPWTADSGRPEPENDFHRHRILGKVLVQDQETQKELIAALKKGTEENKTDEAKCFWPRHGIRATHKGKTVDLAVCFYCLQMEIYTSDDPARKEKLLTSKSPEAVFDKVLQGAGIPLGKIPGK